MLTSSIQFNWLNDKVRTLENLFRNGRLSQEHHRITGRIYNGGSTIPPPEQNVSSSSPVNGKKKKKVHVENDLLFLGGQILLDTGLLGLYTGLIWCISKKDRCMDGKCWWNWVASNESRAFLFLDKEINGSNSEDKMESPPPPPLDVP